MLIPEKKKTSPQQGRQAGEIRVTGCAQGRVSEIQCPGVAVGKYVLLEDDVALRQSHPRSVFMCTHHGKLYNKRVKDKRCSRAGRLSRGCWLEKDGTWSLDCPDHMQVKLDEVERRHEEEIRARGRMRCGERLNSSWSRVRRQDNQIDPARVVPRRVWW